MNIENNEEIQESELNYEFADLDTTWINEFEALEKDYNSYYNEDLSFIYINYVYVNNKNEIINISKEKYLFKKPGLLTREELVGLIKHNTIHNSVKYSLLSLLKYNIDFEPINLKTFLRSKDKSIGNNYLKSISNIDTIVFEKSISLFHDINNLFIIFIDKYSSTNNLSNLSLKHKQMTKKVYIHDYVNNKKRTKCNRFKEMV
jgi:hypothetical protein